MNKENTNLGPGLPGLPLLPPSKTFCNDKHLCISVQKYSISNGAESTCLLVPTKLVHW